LRQTQKKEHNTKRRRGIDYGGAGGRPLKSAKKSQKELAGRKTNFSRINKQKRGPISETKSCFPGMPTEEAHQTGSPMNDKASLREQLPVQAEEEAQKKLQSKPTKSKGIKGRQEEEVGNKKKTRRTFCFP